MSMANPSPKILPFFFLVAPDHLYLYFYLFFHVLFSLLPRGLDSSSSAYCVQMLNNLAREGRTIICTIHQPSAAIYDIFDQVYVMAEGYCVYKGSPANTLSYLSSNGLNCPVYHNVADFRMYFIARLLIFSHID